jgi:hypothetical protein
MAILTKAQIADFIDNGTPQERLLANEVQRLNSLVVKWRNRVPAEKRDEYAGRKVEIKHRYHIYFDGRSYEVAKREESKITCPDKNNGCENCRKAPEYGY